jgi:hypothetical protein
MTHKDVDYTDVTADNLDNMWTESVRRIRTKRSAIASSFAGTTASFDPDGTLCITFPSKSVFAIKLASRPDNRAVVLEAISEVFGDGVPVRYERVPEQMDVIGVSGPRITNTNAEAVIEAIAAIRQHLDDLEAVLDGDA